MNCVWTAHYFRLLDHSQVLIKSISNQIPNKVIVAMIRPSKVTQYKEYLPPPEKKKAFNQDINSCENAVFLLVGMRP